MERQDNQTSFSGWARVEVMGHQTHIGFVTTQVFGQAVMFRVDQPEVTGSEEITVQPQWIGDAYAPVGSIVKRSDIPAASVLIGAGSIYRIIPCDEAAAMRAIRAEVRPALMLVKMGEVRALASPGVAPEDDEDEYLRSLEEQSARAPF